MSSIVKSKYYRFNGTEWVQFLFETSADLIIETQNYKVMTADERQKISTYLTSFNKADKLVQLNSEGKIDVRLIPSLNQYAKLDDVVSFYTVTVDDRVNTSGLSVSAAALIKSLYPYGTNKSVSVKTDLDMNNEYRILNLPSPQNDNEAATKGYVDALAAVGTRPVESVVAATTSNINPYGEITIDGYTVRTGDRVLVWKQSNKSEN